MYRNDQINLEPPYQRKPAWKFKQRRLLLGSLFNGIPIPALIFHKHFERRPNKDIYDVLDGKQRIETILHFIGLRPIKFEEDLPVIFINPHTSKKETLYYDDLRNRRVKKEYENLLEKFWRYEIPIIEYEELIDFFGRNVASKEVFVRINSTGSPLRRHEIRHAESSGPFFNLGSELERKYQNLFLARFGVINQTDIARYSFHEFILELCTAIQFGHFTDRRRKLDDLLSNHQWSTKEIRQIKKTFTAIISWTTDIFPRNLLRSTKFRNKSDFYSLFVILVSLYQKHYVTTDRKSNRTAGTFLLTFSKRIQALEPNVKKYNSPRFSASDQRLFQYVVSTRQATDSAKNREFRHNFLLSVLKDGFILKRKDSNRTFDENVKGLLWTRLLETSSKPKCPNPLKNTKCKKLLKYDDAQVDHKYPWSKGGSTTLNNARLICSSCNSSKGNR